MVNETSAKPKRKATGAAARGAGPGRPMGSTNKTTAQLKEAILLAAEQTGADGKGKEGTVGYLKLLAREEPKAFAGLLGKVLPLQLTGEGDGPLIVEIVRFGA